MASELIVREEQFEEFVKVSIIGEIDIYTAQSLKEKLYNIVETFKKDLRIDCKDLNYLDSTGLGVFVGTLKKAKQNDNQIVMFNMKDNIKKLFLITGLDKLFVIE